VAVKVLLLLAVWLASESGGGPDNVRFYWGAQVATGSESAARYAPAADVLSVQRGDRIQFYFSPVTPACVYLLRYGADGSLTTFFPQDGQAAVLPPGTDQYFPAKNSWFAVDAHPGRETILLLVSTGRLTTLEDRLRAHQAAAPAARGPAAAAVLKEVGRLRMAHGPTPKPPGRPVPIAGTFRSAAPDVTTLAVLLSAPDLYARTYVLEK
jgi:hypothetical protein